MPFPVANLPINPGLGLAPEYTGGSNLMTSFYPGGLAYVCNGRNHLRNNKYVANTDHKCSRN